MAQKRMIDKKVSVSEQVADLPVVGQLIFTWSIPHADDIGFLPYSHRSLKAMIVPMLEITLEEFSKVVALIVSKGLWKEVEYGEDKFYFLVRFREHQTLKRDRQPQTLLKYNADKDPKVSWSIVGEILEQLGIQVEDGGFQMDTEEKGSEEKRKEEKRISEMFEKFWKAYPRKVAKSKAKQSFENVFKRKPDTDFKDVLEGLEKYKKCEQWTKDNGQFIPHPTTWLNQERWNDEIEVVIKKSNVRKI